MGSEQSQTLIVANPNPPSPIPLIPNPTPILSTTLNIIPPLIPSIMLINPNLDPYPSQHDPIDFKR